MTDRSRRILRNILALAIAFVAISAWQTRDLLSAGEMAPAFSAETLDGQPFRLADLRGKTVVLYFFAPWCGVCKLSTGNTLWLRHLVNSDKVAIETVALDYESTASIETFASGANLARSDVVKGSDTIRDDFKIGAYPTYYVIDAEGRVKFVSVGYSTLVGMLFRVWMG